MPTIAIGNFNSATNTRTELLQTYGIEPGYIVRISDFNGKQKSEFRTMDYSEAKIQFQYANGNGEFALLD